MKITGIIVTIMLSMNVISCFAQDFKSDVARMGQSYNNIKNFKMTASLNYINNATGMPVYQGKSSVERAEKTYFCSNDISDMLVTEKSLIMIFKNEKRMLYKRLNKEAYDVLTHSLITAGVDTLIVKYDSVHYEGINNSRKEYKMFCNDCIIKTTSLWMDTSQYLLNGVKYEYNAGDLQKYSAFIQYKYEILREKLTSATMDESRYVIKTKNSIKASPTYQTYELQILEE